MSSRNNGTPTEPEAPIEPALLASPGHITVPRWVKLSGISADARALVDELVDGTARVHGDMAPTLDRSYLAWVLGSSRYDKRVPTALQELVDIDFLVVYTRGGVDRRGNQLRRHDSRTGQKLPDTYGLRLDPPDSYTGPRNRAEAYDLFCRDRDDAHQAAKTTGKGSRAVSIPRKSFHISQVTATPPVEGVGSATTPPVGGTPAVSAGGSHTPAQGCGHTPAQGCGAVSAGGSHTPAQGYLEREREGTPYRSSLPRLIEGPAQPAALDGAATTPPTPSGDALEVVKRLPWRPDQRPNRNDANSLANRIDAVHTEAELSYRELGALLNSRISSPRIHRQLSYAFGALNPDKLPIPGMFDQDDQPQPEKPGTTSVQEVKQGRDQQVPALPACQKCGAAEGAPLATRMVETANGKAVRRCDCRTLCATPPPATTAKR